MKYRSEIDGLRALAVIPVILFHADLEIFSGGYVGVDAFFVVSGYLITSIILNEMDSGCFSLINFYTRRIKRILPGLVIVVIICFPFAWVWMLPPEFKTFSKSVIWLSFFASNIFFWKNTGYFDLGNEMHPFLHTWSLAVEEQFYILFPIFLLISIQILQLNRKVIEGFLIISLIFSLLLAEWGSLDFPTANLYLLPTRIWEILSGALIAFISIRYNPLANQIRCEVLTFIGLTLLIVPIFIFSTETRYPSLLTAVPVLGTGIFLLFSHGSKIVASWLRLKPIVFVGLISYSLYLWHLPTLVMARYYFNSDIPNSILPILLVIIFSGSFVSWKYIEDPIRKSSAPPKLTLFLAAITIAALTIGVTLASQQQKKKLNVNQSLIVSAAKFNKNKYIGITQCNLNSNISIPSDFSGQCINNDARIFLWGDSHADSLAIGIKEVFGKVTLLSGSSCPPILDQDFFSMKNCRLLNKYIFSKIGIIKPEIVVLSAYWINYGNRISNLELTISKIKELSPHSKILVVGTFPIWGRGLQKMLIAKNKPLHNNYLRPPRFIDQLKFDLKLRDRVLTAGGIYLSALNTMCPNNLRCLTASKDAKDNWRLTTYDYGHLTDIGAVIIAQSLKSLISE